MVLSDGLQPGSRGGHGPIRYFVASYRPGQGVRFTFTAPAGFAGFHEFEIEELAADTTLLRHTVRMETTGAAVLTWPLVFGPLHDALVEDGLDKAARALGLVPEAKGWSCRVRFLRRMLGRRRRSRTGQVTSQARSS
jgi:hypothetical protein